MKYPLAPKEQQVEGWILDVAFLEKIAANSKCDLSIESVEAVLLAAQKYIKS